MEWRDIPPLFDDIKPYYIINEYGEVRNKLSGVTIIPHENDHGYLQVSLMTQTGRVFRKVHRLVLMVFNYIPGCEFLEGNHKDGNKRNNWIGNLEWATSKENKAHAIKTGLSNGLIGSANPMAIIDEGKARMIAAMIIWGYNDYYIANTLCNGNVDIVRNIKSGKTWSNLFTENQLNLMRSKIRTHKIQDSDRHLICKYYQDNKNLYTGYGSVSKMAKDALLNIGYEINDTNFRIAKRLYYRYESPEITSLYNY